jgi:ATP-binding cassette subfamily F protein 3
MSLRLSGIGKSFGDRILFRGVDLEVRAGDRIGLVGPNGAGKTTLLRVAAGAEAPDEGQRHVPRGCRLGWLRQEIDPASENTVRAEAASALAELDQLADELASLEARMAEGGNAGVPPAIAERYDAVQQRFGLLGGFEREARVERVLAGLGFDEEARGRKLSTFSGGWLMRVELGKLLLAEPDVLLLDEPTNHLDLPSIQWFEETLESFRGGVIVISHDRTFLRRHVRRVAELHGGAFTLYEAGYDKYLEQREQRRAELLARKRSQDRQIAETERFVERFRAKASKARQVQSRVKALEKLERVSVDEPNTRRMRLRIPDPARAGATPLELRQVHKSYGEQVIYRGVDLTIRRGERVALVGPNGAGKSTLLRILAGVLPFEAGERVVGHNAEVAFYAQHQLESLDVSRTVLQELEAVARTDDYPRLRSHLGAFLFSGDDVEKKVSVLSGGEKARLALARLLLRPANVLVLDEPTNHLDVEACQVLETALAQYKGTLLVISHDRAFLNVLATRVIEVRAGVLREFLGNYDDYLRRSSGEAEVPAAEPSLPGGAGGGAGAARPAAAPNPRSGAERHRQERERRRAREKLERRLEKSEAAILEWEAELETLGLRLGDPEVYRDGEQVRALEEQRTALRAEIDAGYRDWERIAAELEALRDGREDPAPVTDGG